ncbi:MAG TPA: spore coat protein GerQ [Bacillota bacterium]
MNEQYGFPQQQPYFYYPASSPAYYPAYYSYGSYDQQRQQPIPEGVGMLPLEQSYIENILRLNRGKHATVYMTIDGNTKVFKGIIRAAGRDHIILRDPNTEKRYLLLMVYLDYVVFDEEINYTYPIDATGQMASYPPR